MAPLKSIPKLCEICLKNVKTLFLGTLLPFREKARTQGDPDFKVLQHFFAENVPQSACTDVLDAVLQDGDLDTEIKARLPPSYFVL